ncbi:MAG TPA: hypothetical protein VGM76_07460 [Lacipirellulaceae bacterium]|jgi:hypothetical protein
MSLASGSARHKFQFGRVHLTIETEPVDIDRNLERHRRLAEVTRELVELLDSHRLAAAWAVGDPAHSATTALLTLSEIQHEVALLGDHHWLGPNAGRKRFAHELARRVSQARAAGIAVSTLVPRVAPIAEHVDLIVKHGLHAVVGSNGVMEGRFRTTVPRALHYGVWEFATTSRLPLHGTWWSGASRKLIRQIRRAAEERATIHLLVDAPALEQEGVQAMRSIRRLIREIGQLHERGLLRAETLGAAAARLSDLPVATPQRSILRLAA